jgi:hypothetical protein
VLIITLQVEIHTIHTCLSLCYLAIRKNTHIYIIIYVYKDAYWFLYLDKWGWITRARTGAFGKVFDIAGALVIDLTCRWDCGINKSWRWPFGTFISHLGTHIVPHQVGVSEERVPQNPTVHFSAKPKYPSVKFPLRHTAFCPRSQRQRLTMPNLKEAGWQGEWLAHIALLGGSVTSDISTCHMDTKLIICSSSGVE